MSKKRATENSWDSDEELLGDAPGINTYSKSTELDILNTEGELEDEDALLSLETDASQANTTNHGTDFYNAEQEHVQDEQAFVFEDVDTGDLEDELNVGGEEEAAYQEHVYQGDGDYEEGYHEEAGVEAAQHLIPVDGENLEVAVSYEQTEGDSAVELQYDEQHDSEREVVLQYGDGGDASEIHNESDQPAVEHESESDSDNEDSRNNRGRFKTERTGVISLANATERASIPDTLEINDEQAEQINKFMSDKPQASQRGGKKGGAGRGGRQNVHSRLGNRPGMGPRPEGQVPGMMHGPRPPFPLGLGGPINPRMLMGIIRGGGMQALRGMLPPGLGGPRGPMGLRMGRPRGPMPPDGPPGGPRGPPPPRGPFPDGPPGQRGPFPDGPPGQRGPFPDGPPGPRGPFPDGPPGPRGPFPDGGPPGTRGPFPMRPGGPGGMRGRMPGPRGPPGERGPFPGGPGGPMPRGPFPGPPGARGPPLPFPPGLRMGPPGPGGPPQLRMRGPPPPAGMMNPNQIRGPRGPSPRPPTPNEGPPPPGMMRSPSPMRSPDPGNAAKWSSVHDRLGPRVQTKSDSGVAISSKNNSAQSSASSPGSSSEGQPIPSLVRSVSANQPPGLNQGPRPRGPQMMNAGFRQPNPRGVGGPTAGGPNKIFINPRFKNPDNGGPTGITRTVRIGNPLQQRRAKSLVDRARGNLMAKPPVLAIKRRSDETVDVPNKVIRIGNNQQFPPGQQPLRNVVSDQNQRNVVIQREDGRPGFVANRLGPRGPGQMVNVPVKGPSSSIQSRLGPPISRRNESNIMLTSSSQQQPVSFNPNVAPPGMAPPRVPPPPNPRGPPLPHSASHYSKPPPNIPPSIRGPPPPVHVGVNRFASPPPGSAPPPSRFSGPPPPRPSRPPAAAAPPPPRFSAPPPSVNVAQPPPGFPTQGPPPPRFAQPPPAIHSTPAPAPSVYQPPPSSQHPLHYPPPPSAAIVAVPTYTALPPAVAAAQPPSGYPATPTSHAQPYQHHPPAAVTAYKPPPSTAAASTYPPTQPPPPSTQQYSLDYYSGASSSTQYHKPQATAASQAYQAPHSYPQSSYYNYSSTVASTQSTRSSSYDSQAVHHITTIGRRAQPATDTQVRSILHNVAPSRSSSSSSSYLSDRVVVDTNVPVLKGSQRVAIYNLAQMATKETLIKVCRHFGRVLNVQLIRDQNKAFVTFETGDQAAKCVSKCDQKCLHKSRLTVKLLPD